MMSDVRDYDFSMERRLRKLNSELHKRFTDTVFALQYNLSNYKRIFPEFTDHTNLHSLSVIDFCNRLTGEQIKLLNADELYVLLTSCYFHDTGMGINMKDYREFSSRIDFGTYFDTHSSPGSLSGNMLISSNSHLLSAHRRSFRSPGVTGKQT